ncbi:MAG: enoyl-CoA hydratase/isomerase family protein [Planctomycetaceae bacterium]|nr:enoyl-CoA hydratase/isomerase family protein [Planctomycetaceae bacterium]
MRNSSTASTQVHLEVEGEVARVTFSGEKGIQILGAETRNELKLVLKDLECLPSLRIVLFQGTGRTFIAGADIQEFIDMEEESGKKLIQDGQQLMSRIAALPAITIAAINGACAGGGFELALACDYRLATSNANVGLPETALGLLPCWGGTIRTTLMFGSAVATRLIVTGELLLAEDAKQIGILHEVCEPSQWEEFLTQWIETLLSRGPTAQREAKRLIKKTENTVSQIELGFSDELNAFMQTLRSGELQIGAQAFLKKQKPVWS